MKKRLCEINKEKNKLEVKIENLILDEAFLSNYETKVLKIIKKDKKVLFLSSLLENHNIDINYIKFALFQIRCIVISLETKEELHNLDFNEDLFSNIINYLLHYNDSEIKVNL